MKLFSYLTFLFFINTAIQGNIQLDSLIELGKEYSYQFEFQKAHQIYEEAIQKYPSSPFAHHYLSQNYLWFYLGSKDSLYKNLYNKYSDMAFSNAELLYEQNENDPQLNNLMGQLFLLRSIMYATEGNSMDAFWAIKSSFSHLEEAIELDQNYYDPYLGIGSIKYALSFVPGFLGWAISITGLSGDKEEGLRLIKSAYDKSSTSRTEASYHLSKIYTEYNAEYDSAKIYLTHLIDIYPNNILFLYQYAILLIDTKELSKADKTLNKIIEIKSIEFTQTTSFVIFLKAEIAFRQNEFDTAILLYDKFLQSSNSIDYTGVAHLKIGIACEMTNKSLLAKKYFILARNGNLDISEDIKAKNDSYSYYSKNFSENDRSLILAENYFESGKYIESLNAIYQVTISDLDFENSFKIRIMEAKSYLLLGEINEAKKVVEDIKGRNNITSTSVLSEYFLVLAKIEYSNANYEKSKEYLNSAFEYCEESNNKLMRYLVNLQSKLRAKKL